MFSALWNLILVAPILNLLMAMYQITANLGLSIILLTILVRAILIPVVIPSMKAMKKQRDIQPELTKLKEKHKGDQRKMAEAQMELFKKHGINPTSGCLSQIVMIIVLIALFSVIQMFAVKHDISKINAQIYFDSFKLQPNEQISTKFGYLDLGKPDPFYILALMSGILQFVASKMMMPLIEKAEKVAEKTEPKTDDIALQMQQQTLYMMPIMNVVIGVALPSGVLLYIVVTTLFTIVQQYYSTGWGGMTPLIRKALKSQKSQKKA
jgi:YidC/Oxa1 family membrane protein insertase